MKSGNGVDSNNNEIGNLIIIWALQDQTAVESNKDKQRRMERHQKQLNGNNTAKIVTVGSTRSYRAAA